MPAALTAPPRGELFDEEVVYCLFVQNAPVYSLLQAPPFEERLPPLRGKMSPQVTKGGIWHRAAMTERAHAVSPIAKVLDAMRNLPGVPEGVNACNTTYIQI